MDEKFLTKALEKRKEKGNLRTLTNPPGLPSVGAKEGAVQNSGANKEQGEFRVDFSSNDYLGFARSPKLAETIREKEERYALSKEALRYRNGAGAARLVSGNYSLFAETERAVAGFHRSEDALVFHAGYDANLGLISAVAGRHDLVFYDCLIHASIRDALVLSQAKTLSFSHNSIDSLREKMAFAKKKGMDRGNLFVVVESVYSMDGDFAPLVELVQLAKKHRMFLIVDEAHATGLFGGQGEGLVCAQNLESEIFARVITFGKGLGVHGAAVAGSSLLKKYLVNFARSFIYTTGMPPSALLAILSAYEMLPQSGGERKRLRENIGFFQETASELNRGQIDSDTKNGGIQCKEGPIQNMVFCENQTAILTEKKAQAAGFDVKAILPPAVPLGTPRLRICLHAFNTKNEIREILELCARS